MTQLVRVDRADTGLAGDGSDVAVDGAPVEGLVVVAFDEQPGARWSSPRPVVEGNLWDIREEFKNGSTRFMITDATGQAVMILCSHRGPGFVQGERARVRYVAYNNKLVEMDMLSGPYGAWHLRESSGEEGHWAWVVIGLFFGLLAYRQLAKTRPGQTTAR